MTDSTAPDAIGALVRETFRAMTKRVEGALEQTEFQLSQWLTLRLIGSGQIKCVGDVTRELGMESGTATRLVDSLEARQLISRLRSSTDRRTVGVYLTDQGAVALKTLRPKIDAFWNEHLNGFSEEDKAQLISLLSRFRDNLRSDI